MHWKHETSRIQTIAVPYVGVGEPYEFTLTLCMADSTESASNAYLVVSNPELAGLVQVRRAGASQWRDVMGWSDASGYIGNVAAGGTVDVEFKLVAAASTPTGLINIPIHVVHDDGSGAPTNLFVQTWSDLWFPDWADVQLWAEDWV